MVQCPVCGEEFDSERGMKIHKSRVHGENTEKQEKELEETLEKKEKKWLREWRPEIAIVTVVGIVAVLLLTAVTITSVNQLNQKVTGLENQSQTYKPPDADKALCNVNGMSKMIYCGNATACVPQENQELKIIAAHQPGKESSTRQREILKNLTKNDPKVTVEYVCVSGPNNQETCEGQEWGTPYSEWNPSEYYTFTQFPTLIANCEYKRTGTFASGDPSKEKQQLKTFINAFK